MIVISVMYPNQPDSHFDWAYYTGTHIPLVREAFGPTGLQSVTVLKGIASGDGGPAPYVAVALLAFADMAAVQATMSGPRAGEVMGDIPNFTNIVPIRQISETV